MRSYLRDLIFVTVLIATTAFGCEKPDTPGEPESTSEMAEQQARADLEGTLEVQINALESAGEHANLEVIVENVSDSPVAIENKDFRVASDSGDWSAARKAPDTLTIEPGASKKATISVALPANQLYVGNISVDVPDVPAESNMDSQPLKPSGKGVHRLELPDDENADGP